MLLLALGLCLGLTMLSHPLHVVGLAALLLLRNRAWTVVGLGLGMILTPIPGQPPAEREVVRGGATVVGVPKRTPDGTYVRIQIAGRDWIASGPQCAELGLGDRVELVGVAHPPSAASRENDLLAGISGNLKIAHLTSLEKGPTIWRAATAWRNSFEGFCHGYLAPGESDLVSALCFDLGGTAPEATVESMKRAGTYHVLSASGLHVFVISYALMGLLGLLPVPRWAQILVLVVALTLYCGATGLGPPVVRASLMSVVGLSAYLFRRERDAVSALALAAVAYLLWHPREIYSAGFQLSFVTVAGMALFLHVEKKEWSIRGLLLEAVRVSWVAALASAPLVAYHFGYVPAMSLPANLLVGFPASAAIVAGLAGHLVAFVFAPIGVGLLTVGGWLAGWVSFASETLAHLPGATIDVPELSPYLVVLIYGLLLMTWRPRIVHP